MNSNTTSFPLRLPSVLKAEMEVVAKAKNRSLNKHIVHLLQQEMDRGREFSTLSKAQQRELLSDPRWAKEEKKIKRQDWRFTKESGKWYGVLT